MGYFVYSRCTKPAFAIVVQLTTLPMMQYGVGPTPGINNLRDFVTHISATVGHFNGEGHCQEQRLAQ